MAKPNSVTGGHSSDAIYAGIHKTLRTLLHLVATTQFCYAIYYDFRYVKIPLSEDEMTVHPHARFGGKFKYLTFLDALIQALYFIICLINDVVGTNEVAPKRVPLIRKAKDYLMASLAFPLALNVGVSFWSLYAIDRELVFPRILDAVFPSWLNHIMHTNIVVFMVLEIFTSFRAYPKRSKGLAGLIFFILSYLIWLHVVKYQSGIWVYPVLEVLQFPMRVLFFTAVVAFTVSMYYLGEYMNNVIWAKEVKLAQRKIK